MKKPLHSGTPLLIAEDSATQAAQLQHLLEKNGYTVEVAANGRIALERARIISPALVISDIIMPELDGYGLCRAIKADAKLKDTPVMLVTSLSDSEDVVRGLECGADNFVRKPYDEHYLLARIEYLLMNQKLREKQMMKMGVEISLGGHKHLITAERQQILDLLISTYEQAIHLNEALKLREKELDQSNRILRVLYRTAEDLNRAGSEKEVLEMAMKQALQLPGVQGGWIVLKEGKTGVRIGAVACLPPGFNPQEAIEQGCVCRRRLLGDDEIVEDHVSDCEMTGKKGGRKICHASIPLSAGGRKLGLMNWMAMQNREFNPDEMKMLRNIADQVAVALERARLHEHLEHLVAERTAKLEAEIVERKRIQEEQARLIAIIEASPNLTGTFDPDGRIHYINQAGLRMLGLETQEDLSGLSFHDVLPDWAGKLFIEEGIPHATRHGYWSGEAAVKGSGGHEIPILQIVIAHKGPGGELAYFSTIGHDISRLKANEARIMGLNRLYSVLSDINNSIIRVRSQQELFDEACRIAVEKGRCRLAWIGLAGSGEKGEIVPVARFGFDEGYIELVTGQGEKRQVCPLIERAARMEEVVLCNDIALEPDMASLREESLNHGYRSMAVFPLKVSDCLVGVFVLYAAETDYFDLEEMRLLIEVAGDISFGLDHLSKGEELNYLAYYDVLTGLPNRTLFLDRLNHLLQAQAQDGGQVAVLVVNLERFRLVNETFGRIEGDALLKQVGARISSRIQEKGFFARINADCFVATFFNFRDESEIVYFLRRNILDSMVEPFMVGKTELRISAKVGIAVFPANGSDADTLFHNAEAAIKKIKHTGDRYLFYNPEINSKVSEKLAMESKLRLALEREQFVLYYQPKIRLATGSICGLEALIRWRDPESGLVPPVRFIPLLEETGLILEVGEWVLEKVVADMLKWEGAGIKPPRIAVNVSQLQMRQDNFVETVKKAGSMAPHLTRNLDLEITESLIMQDIEQNLIKLGSIRGMGMEIAVDDFGTGYSSLSYLTKLPVNSLKIDRSFIVNMTRNSDDMSIVSAIISLAHSLGIKVIAEGVETEGQAKLLKMFKCDEIQGFIFSPAISMEEIAVMLKSEKRLVLD